MAQRAYVEDIGRYEGQQVTLKGWLYNKTDKGKLQFLLIRDGTGIIQAVAYADDIPPESLEAIQQLTQESSIVVTGTVRADLRAPGGYELSITDLEIVQLADPYPITPKEHGVGFLMDHRHLWLRSARQHAILRVRAEIIRACRDYFDNHGFVLVDTPILTPAACEGTSTLFETDYFGDSAYLAQSGQLYSEASIASLGKVYCFGPTFRAEKSKTRRHLLEFWMVEPEVAFADLDDCMELAENFVTYIVQTTLEKRAEQLQVLERDTSLLQKVQPPFPRITYDEAVRILQRKGFNIEWGTDFGAPDETALAEEFDRPLLVHHYPAQCKAFYMEPDPDRPELSLSVDCLAPEGYGEIIGGGQRIADYDLLLQRVREHNLPREA
ncbi:MAG: asparagine--tRNA ligase, partial [Anaerolineae bacterium]|nr:asparagine--tRNA ligase [Anaerolineae bacterium]